MKDSSMGVEFWGWCSQFSLMRMREGWFMVLDKGEVVTEVRVMYPEEARNPSTEQCFVRHRSTKFVAINTLSDTGEPIPGSSETATVNASSDIGIDDESSMGLVFWASKGLATGICKCPISDSLSNGMRGRHGVRIVVAGACIDWVCGNKCPIQEDHLCHEYDDTLRG
ncbi:hypothetical protein V6N11_067549 [Hibiscus sabdariffa]|uniref:Uncharacterized protein n=1 Tax=Hibiscus sabdariffa TaxID=183260 RepID=A0ABR2SRT7_9ROSI